MKPVGWRDHLFGAILLLVYVTLLANTSLSIGMSRDEGFYVQAAHAYAAYYESVLQGDTRATDPKFIDRIWSYNHEHPPLMKSLFALFFLADQKWDLFPFPSLAYRFSGMLCAGLLLWLTYIFGTRVFGRACGVFAALCLALMPRVFYHSHLAAFDIPIAFMTTWVTYAYWRSLTDRRWVPVTVLAYGLALATKHNSWALPWIFSIHFFWVWWVERMFRKRDTQRSLSLIPWTLIAMVPLGPFILVGCWPWLWRDTLPRIAEYMTFHTQHVYYNMAYFGENYFKPPFPISYPWVMTLFTIPITLLLLCLLGMGYRCRDEWFALFRGRESSDESQSDHDPRQTVVLFLGCLLAPLVLISLPTSPIFGGTKHWMTAYPFLAMFAASGFAKIVDWGGRMFTRLPRSLLQVGLASILLIPSTVETAHSHPFALSHYGVAACGVPGAADHGMNRQFWGFTTGSLVEFFNRNLPRGGKVFVCDTTFTAWNMLIQDGLMNANIRPVLDIPSADYAMVHHEHHFVEVDYQIWNTYGSVQPAYVLLYDGVPIISVYENPKGRPNRRP